VIVTGVSAMALAFAKKAALAAVDNSRIRSARI
jgi:hypothetical protein